MQQRVARCGWRVHHRPAHRGRAARCRCEAWRSRSRGRGCECVGEDGGGVLSSDTKWMAVRGTLRRTIRTASSGTFVKGSVEAVLGLCRCDCGSGGRWGQRGCRCRTVASTAPPPLPLLLCQEPRLGCRGHPPGLLSVPVAAAAHRVSWSAPLTPAAASSRACRCGRHGARGPARARPGRGARSPSAAAATASASDGGGVRRALLLLRHGLCGPRGGRTTRRGTGSWESVRTMRA